MTIVLAAVAALLFALGTYLILQRKLSRVIIGLGLLTHGANLLLALAFRSWILTRDDEVQDDVGDRAIARSDATRTEVTDQQHVNAREDQP